ncbi:HD domain-containing protein [bacterium]|nr:HD domain-containing protein [bacterium]MBU4510185.1 HD domain-containing protein [bacterium]
MIIPAELVDDILKGNCALFLGAGASVGSGAPSSKELAKTLADQFLEGYHSEDPLPKVAAYIESKPGIGRLPLVKYLEERLSNLSPSSGYVMLARFKWKAIYTTNYDMLTERGYEQAFEKECRYIRILQSKEFPNIENSRNYVPIYKLHGCISHPFSEETPLIITEDDYHRNYTNKLALLHQLQVHIYRCPLIFIGYSFADYSLSEIWFEITKELGPFKIWSYAIWPNHTKYEKLLWRHRHVELIDCTFQKFFEQISTLDKEDIRELSWALGESRLVELVKGLVDAIDARDSYTKGHSIRVQKMASLISNEMNINKNERYIIEIAALLHDFGKIFLKDSVLMKSEALTQNEFNQIKSHSVVGANILRKIKGLEKVAAAIEHHHEQFNGRGYPKGLSGEDIPIASRIIAVADAYDSMTSPRPYRKGLTKEEALKEITNMSGIMFDPKVVIAIRNIANHIDFNIKEIKN